MCHGFGDTVLPLRLATVSANVFTDPEIATVGFQAVEAAVERAAGRRIDLSARDQRQAKMQGIEDGFVKACCRAGTGIVLGGGRSRGELILPVSVAVQHGWRHAGAPAPVSVDQRKHHRSGGQARLAVQD